MRDFWRNFSLQFQIFYVCNHNFESILYLRFCFHVESVLPGLVYPEMSKVDPSLPSSSKRVSLLPEQRFWHTYCAFLRIRKIFNLPIRGLKGLFQGSGLNWTVQTIKTGRSWAKVDGLRNWTDLKSKSGRSERRKTGRSKWRKLKSHKGWK